MPIYALGDLVPQIAASAYINPDAVIIGDVEIGEDASVWPGAIVRGDNSHITIGARTSIQDGTVVHCTELTLTTIGEDCVIGHNAYVEGCVIEDRCLVGSSANILNYAHVGHDCLIAAGAVVLEHAIVPPMTLMAGVPAKARGPVPEAIVNRIAVSAAHYVDVANRFARDLRRID